MGHPTNLRTFAKNDSALDQVPHLGKASSQRTNGKALQFVASINESLHPDIDTSWKLRPFFF